MESYSSRLRGQIANLLVCFKSSKSSNLLLSANIVGCLGYFREKLRIGSDSFLIMLGKIKKYIPSGLQKRI